mmetsp:Transcript_103526/g.297389  ORF Transcript_103526/g.297389 Transcript_103526/m.297389 type:complete len:513 (+) Transcript_103526:18-1556(+)
MPTAPNAAMASTSAGMRRLLLAVALGCASCAAAAESIADRAHGEAFWEEMRRRGLSSRLAVPIAAASSGKLLAGTSPDAQTEDEDHNDADQSGGGKTTTGSGSATLAADVFYGRPVLRIPEAALFTPENIAAGAARPCLEGKLTETTAHKRATLGLALALAVERRAMSSSSAHFGRWLDAVFAEPPPPVLALTDRQIRAIAGTTVAELHTEISQDVALIDEVAQSCTTFAAAPLTRDESVAALGVVLRHSLAVESSKSPSPGTGLETLPVLVPMAELLAVARHPDIQLAVPLQESAVMTPSGEEKVLVQVARRDMSAGEEAPSLWPGRFSNSELALRHGERYPRNPIGIGGNITLPKNWSPNRNTPNFREYGRYNCTSPSAFEVRLSPKGWPMRSFIRCARVAYHLARGSYDAAFIDRMDLLDKWPPPKKYKVDDWLAWTQGDQTINLEIHAYCMAMKRQLKETITAAVADDFRKSTDPTDVLLWRLRSEETRTFRECVALSRSIGSVGESS